MIDFEFTGYVPIDGKYLAKFVNKFGEVMVWDMPEEEIEKFDDLIKVWINKYIEWRIVPCTCDGEAKEDSMPIVLE